MPTAARVATLASRPVAGILAALAVLAAPLAAGVAAAPPPPFVATVAAEFSSGNLPGSQVSALFVNAANGQVLYSRDAALRLQPASTLKLLVSAAALSDLGPGYRFVTRVEARVAPAGTVAGDLYIVGSGDPVFDDQNLAGLAKAVARRVHRVDGSVLVDGAYFAGPYGEGWERDNDAYGWSAAPEALTLDMGQIVAVVHPGAAPGDAPHIVVTPAADATLVADAVTTAAGTADTLEALWPPGQGPGVLVQGDIPAGSPPVRLTVSVRAPDAWAAELFRSDLTADGVAVEGGVGSGTAPAGLPTVAEHVSHSLAALLVHQDRWSINVSAEDLLRVVGAHVYGGPGTAAKGIRAEQAWLRSQGIAFSATIVDGCGLSVKDRVSAQDLVNLLLQVRRERWYKDLIGALPVAGAKGQAAGTLGEIGLFLGFKGMVWAKTGDVANVENLAGYIRQPDGTWVVFAALVNGQPYWLAGWRSEEAAVEAVADG